MLKTRNEMTTEELAAEDKKAIEKHCIRPQHIIDDIHRFREKMGLRSSDLDELQKLFASLMGCWAMARSTRQHPDATQEELDMMDMAFECLEAEWPRRFAMMAMGPMYPHKQNKEM